MQKKTNQLEIPAVLMHEVDGVQYRLNGTIVGINESKNTCSMQFEGYPVFNGIPMDSIYINEAFLDKVKEYGKKAWQGIKKLIKAAGGFLFPTNADGEADMEYLCSPINIAISEMKGSIIKFCPSAAIAEVAAEHGIKLPHAGEDPGDVIAEDDVKQIEAYWTRVMKTYAKNESMGIADAVKYVNENYYASVKSPLNEASTLSLGNIRKGQYGKEMGTAELASNLVTNILNQISGTFDEHAKEKPYLIWGAPGVGKTAAVKAAIQMLQDVFNLELSLEQIPCGGVYRDDFVIPAVEKNAMGQPIAVDVPKVWLPIYRQPVDREVWKDIDDFYNAGLYKHTESQLTLKDGTKVEPTSLDGGIIFLDEFMRLPDQSKNIVMNLINDHYYAGMRLASKWGFVLASNRAFDVLDDEKASIWEPAQASRYISVTYVPGKDEWLSWARSINSKTELQTVDEMICKFIEQTPIAVWYDGLMLGSRNTELSQDEITTLDSDDFEALQTIQKENDIALDKTTWNPRDWAEKINNPIIGVLRNQLFRGQPELFKDCFTDGNIDWKKLERNLNKLPDSTWNLFAAGKKAKIDPNGKLSRRAFFQEYFTYRIQEVTGEKSLPATEWENHKAYKSVFIPEVISNIWENGDLGDPKLKQDDDKYFETPAGYQNTTHSKWKKNSYLMDEVSDLIINGYPGGDSAVERDVKRDLALIEKATAKPLTDAAYQKLFKKYSEHYSVKVGQHTVYLLYKPEDGNPSDEFTKKMQKNCLMVLDTSEFARGLANVAMYISKVSMQMHSDSKVAQLVGEVLCNWFYEHISDKELKQQVVPTKILSGMSNEEEQLLTSKMLGYSAATILNNTMHRDQEFAIKGSY